MADLIWGLFSALTTASLGGRLCFKFVFRFSIFSQELLSDGPAFWPKRLDENGMIKYPEFHSLQAHTF